MEIRVTKKINKKEKKIKSVREWYKYAPPQNPKVQWKEGHSAKLLARYVLSENFASDMTKILNECGIKLPSALNCEPEVNTKLPHGSMGRNHDLLIVDSDFVIGAEAKASETFGNKIECEYNKSGIEKRNRINKLLEYIGKSKEEAINNKYQLLTGLVGTLLEAQRNNKSRCIFLIIIFKGDIEGNSGNNDSDFKKFCEEILGASSNGGKRHFIIEGHDILCYIKKIEIDVTLNFRLNR